MKSLFKSILRKAVTGIIVTVMLTATTINANAATSVNEKVKEAQEGVYAIELVYEDSADKGFPIQSGSAFFINPTTLLTCYHVVSMNDETEGAVEALAKEFYGSYSKGNVRIDVMLQSDISVEADVMFTSPEGDWAVLHLNESIKNSPLVFGNSDDAQNTQNVYAIGFPSSVANYKSINNFTRDDITTTKGEISKITSDNDVKKIQHGATLSEGNSGGPLVDENGAVIGINNEGIIDKDYYYAIATEQILNVLEQKQIEFTRYSENAIVDNGSSIDETSAEAETTVPALTNEATESNKSNGLSTKTIVLICAGAGLVIMLAVIAFLVTRKKPATLKAPSASEVSQPTIAQMFTLTRVKNKEKAIIDKITFVVGKDKACDYCIEGNSSISRNHARFIVKGSDCYISDMRSTNGTYVNNKRISPNQEILLRSGDVIRISDEEFEFRV